MKLNDPTLLRTDAYINGTWVTAPSDKRFAVTNPANNEVIAEVYGEVPIVLPLTEPRVNVAVNFCQDVVSV